MTEAKQSRLFVPASELQPRARPLRKEDGLCDMCGGREAAMSIGSACLEAAIETAIEKMVDAGRLDAIMQRVLDRRLARASIPPSTDDHELVDEYSGEIRD